MSFTVTVESPNAGQVAGRFALMRDRLRFAIARAPEDAAKATVPAFRLVAPVDTGRLKSRIHQEGGEVISDVVDPRSGFHYTGVTRFGHRHADPDRIFPRAGGRALGPMLGGRFFASVARYHPAEDWAGRGMPDARRAAGDKWRELVHDAIR